MTRHTDPYALLRICVQVCVRIFLFVHLFVRSVKYYHELENVNCDGLSKRIGIFIIRLI